MEAFLTSAVPVALAEIGDKTQLLSFVLAACLRKPMPIIAGIFVATIANHALAARFDALAAVVLGTTLGMLIANIPAVLVGEALAQKLPMKAIRIVAAGVFIATVLVTMFGIPGIAQ